MLKFCYGRAIVPTTKIEYIPVEFVDDPKDLQAAVSVLARYRRNLARIKYVEDALEDFAQLKKTMQEPTFYGQIALERKARSFFLEFDMFLDHWQKYIAHHPEHEKFKNLMDDETHKAFDSSDDYALATMLRNYIAHNADVIQTSFWGAGHYDVGCHKKILLSDKTFNKTKRAIIERQPADLISLTRVMGGALAKLSEVHSALMTFDMDEAVKAAAEKVAPVINKIRESGTYQNWYFYDEDGPELMTTDSNGKPIEFIKGQYVENLPWKDYEELINGIVSITRELE